VFIPDSDEDDKRSDATWRALRPTKAAAGGRRSIMPSTPKTDSGLVVPAVDDGNPERPDDMRQNRLSGALPLNYASQKAIMRSGTGADLTPPAERHFAGYLQPDVSLAIQAWNAMSDLRTTFAALNATSAPGLPALAQNHRLNANDTAGLVSGVGSVAASSSRLSERGSELLDGATVLGTASSSVPEPRDGLQMAAATYPQADLRSDELHGGHTIERHVGKTQSDLNNRLGHAPDLDAVSTYHDIGEATVVTQQVLDANRERIASWLADPAMEKRLVVSVSRPVTSSRYVPIGTVVRRALAMPIPGNGARVILERDPDAPNGFTVITSYPTFSASPSMD
jgi:hypothetical protein